MSFPTKRMSLLSSFPHLTNPHLFLSPCFFSLSLFFSLCVLQCLLKGSLSCLLTHSCYMLNLVLIIRLASNLRNTEYIIHNFSNSVVRTVLRTFRLAMENAFVIRNKVELIALSEVIMAVWWTTAGDSQPALHLWTDFSWEQWRCVLKPLLFHHIQPAAVCDSLSHTQKLLFLKFLFSFFYISFMLFLAFFFAFFLSLCFLSFPLLFFLFVCLQISVSTNLCVLHWQPLV